MTIKRSPETETSVLGTLITLADYNSIHVQKAMLKLNRDCFYKTEAAEIFDIIKNCYEKKSSFDVIAMTDYLHKSTPNVWEYFETSLKGPYFSKNKLVDNVITLVTLKNLRQTINLTEKIIADCNEERLPHEATNILRNGVAAIGMASLNKEMQGSTLEEITTRYWDEEYSANSIVKTNVVCLDDMLLGGVANQSLVTICGDSGVGKTFFSIYLMRMITKCIPEKQSLFFSLEMSEDKIWERLVAIEGKKQFSQMHTIERAEAAHRCFNHKITIFEEQFKDIDQIETVCRVKSIEQPLAVIVIDYLTLVEMTGKFERNDLKQSAIAKRLASLAMELDCIVIALSQANRDLSKRKADDRCPYSSDAADSLGSFRSSSLWFGIDRPEIHDDNHYLKNKFVVKCRKNRYGQLFEAVWAFNHGTFMQVDQNNYFQKPLAEIIRNPFDYKK